jgi:hypothetical protein
MNIYIIYILYKLTDRQEKYGRGVVYIGSNDELLLTQVGYTSTRSISVRVRAGPDKPECE